MVDFKVITQATSQLTGKLDYLSTRHDLLVQNLAHLETPGYLEKDISFEGFLKQESATGNVATEAKYSMSESTEAIKSNGNSVQLEQEMSKLASNSVEFMTAVEVLKKHIDLMKTSIMG